jgi:hypothetical protein
VNAEAKRNPVNATRRDRIRKHSRNGGLGTRTGAFQSSGQIGGMK